MLFQDCLGKDSVVSLVCCIYDTYKESNHFTSIKCLNLNNKKPIKHVISQIYSGESILQNFLTSF